MAISQDAPIINKDTIITVTLTSNCELYNGSTVTISGLQGSQTASLTDLAQNETIFDVDGAAWDQTAGTLALTTNTSVGVHWPGDMPVVLTFTLLQSATPQGMVQVPAVEGVRTWEQTFVWWLNTTTPIPQGNISINTATILGVVNGSYPMLAVGPEIRAKIGQTSPFAGYTNQLRVTLSSNVDLLQTDSATITLSGLTQLADGTYVLDAGSSTTTFGATLLATSEEIILTVQSGETMLSNTDYFVFFTITNGAANSEALHINVTLNLATFDGTNNAVTASVGDASVLPFGNLLGVTDGLNGLKTVIPFETATIDDQIDTPGAPNVITVTMMTNIAFVTNDVITISGLVLDDPTAIQQDIASSAAGYFSSFSLSAGGELTLVVGTTTLGERTTYSFAFYFKNPAAPTSSPSYTISSVGGAGGTIVPVAMSPNATSNPDSAIQPIPINTILPVFTEIAYAPALSGSGSNLTLTFTANDEVDTSKINQGVVTFLLPGFTGGGNNGISLTSEISGSAAFTTGSWLRAGVNSKLSLTATGGVAAFDGQQVVIISTNASIKLPAEALANDLSIYMKVGPDEVVPIDGVSYDWTLATPAACAIAPVVAALVTGLKVNDLTAAGVSAAAVVPKSPAVQIELSQSTTIFADADAVSFRANASTCYLATQGVLTSAGLTADLALTLSSTALTSSSLDTSALDAGSYKMCYAGADIKNTSGTDSETAIMVTVQDYVYTISLLGSADPVSFVEEAPRNDFTLTLTGGALDSNDIISLVPNAQSCITNVTTGPTTAGDVNLASGVATLPWADCVPVLNGMAGAIMDGDNCPHAGLYRLCFTPGEMSNVNGSVVQETGISVNIKQAQVNITDDGGFVVDHIHEVNTPFNIVVTVTDPATGLACCRGAKVHLSLTKHGVAYSDYLYNADGSNANADKIIEVGPTGIASFLGYTIQRTAGINFYFTASVAGHSINIPAGGPTDTFVVRPNKIVVTTDLASEYIVGADLSADLLAEILVEARDAAGTLLTGLVTDDAYDVQVRLHSGGNGIDSGLNGNYSEVPASSADLSQTSVVWNTSVGNFSGLQVKNQAGRYFKLYFFMTDHTVVIGESTIFMVSPNKMKLTYATTDYAAATFPVVVRLDGMSSNTPDVDGLPAQLTVSLLDSDGATLAHSQCLTNCFAARLVKCDNSVPTNGTIDGTSIANALPGGECDVDHATITAIDNTTNGTGTTDIDQMVGTSQAYCATTGGECTSATSFAQTLSSSSTVAAGTTSEVVNGVATFSNLQPRYVFGSGYKLRFVMDFEEFEPTGVTVTPGGLVMRSVHTAGNGNIFFPDAGSHQTAVTKSFFIRPYALEIAQTPGGDGVDLDGITGLYGDNTTLTPDGVGQGQVFRVQPAVLVKGYNSNTMAEYYFTKNWGTHGHAPVAAFVRSSTCNYPPAGTGYMAGTCETQNITLSGNLTGPSRTCSLIAANTGTGTDLGTCTAGASITAPELVHNTLLGVDGHVGMLWQDLQIGTKDATTGYEGLQLQIVSGIETNTNASVNAGKATSVYTGRFDVFVQPDPVSNLRVSGYGELGFRVEWDPAEIFRLKPLSGFIIEVDFCTRSGALNGSCALEATPGYAASLGVPTRELGSDFYRGGGRTEDVVLTYSGTAPGVTDVTIDMVPTEHLGAGDTITIVLDSPGLYIAADATCAPSGTHAALLDAAVNVTTGSTITLMVATDKTIFRGTPFQVTLSGCGIYLPDPSGTAGSADLFEYQLSSYGTSAPSPKTFVLAYISGTALRGDNCKSSGCNVSSTKVLPFVQDASSMDLTWSGNLSFSGIGAACSGSVRVPRTDTTTKPFPSNRYCAPTGTGSNDPEPNDAVGNSGDNGAPIGQNPGRLSTTTGTVFYSSSNTEATCRSGTGTRNPCALSVGTDWTTSAVLAWTHNGASASQVVFTIRRDRYTPVGAKLTVVLAGSNGGDDDTAGSNSSMTIVVAKVDGGALLADWSAAWVEASASIVLTAGTSVAPETEIAITIAGLTLATTSFPATRLVAVDHQVSRTSVIFKKGASSVTYSSAVGDPTGAYTPGTAMTIAAGDIVNVRVYAYNGRFRSAPATTLVQSRAITKPAAPAYFPSQMQSSVVVALVYDNPTPSEATNITATFTPDFDLLNGTYVSVVLPNFGGPLLASLFNETATQYAVYKAGGVNTHDVFTSAEWVKNTTSLVFRVGEGSKAAAGTQYSVFVSMAVGITYPADGVVPLLPDGTSGTRAFVTRYQLNWVSTFPTASAPRKGFVIQMTTNRDWISDIQTFKMEDKLNRGIADLRLLGQLDADTLANSTTITLQDPTMTSLITNYNPIVGFSLKIRAEYLKVISVTGREATVLRGAYGSVASAHTNTTMVYLAYLGATDPMKSTNEGFDKRVGTAANFENPSPAADGCLLGTVNFPKGCNVRSPPVGYPAGIRSHQTAFILPGATRVTSLTNCRTSGDVCTSAPCRCVPPTSESLVDLGSVLEGGRLQLRNTGNPLQWAITPTTTLSLKVNFTTVKNLILANAAPVTGSYLRIGDELMYVEGPKAKGIGRVFLYNGPTGCTCDNTGNGRNSTGGSCACTPSNLNSYVANCTEGGTLMAVGGGGTGFAAAFTVNATAGTIDTITITDPGYGYVQNPTIIIASGGTGCGFQNIAWKPLINNNVVRVERGSYGTTPTLHDANLPVGLVTWPLRGGFQSPGTQYYFRIAAYNDAGMSNWMYYLHAITEINPRLLATNGNTNVEVVMEGGGYLASNAQIYIGKMRADLQGVDLTRSKLCNSLVVDDNAGTRLTCVTPAWVGRQHDLIVRFKSGSIEKYSVGTNFVNFPPPVISTVAPQKIERGATVTLTVTGQNFGRHVAEVSGALRTATGEVPCSPIVLKADTSLECTLVPRAGVIMEGNLVISVGRDFFSGGRQNTSIVTEGQVKEIEAPVEVEMTFAGDIAELLASPARQEQFKVSVALDVARALGIPSFRVTVLEIRGGSIIVVFVILPDPNSVSTLTPAQAAAEVFRQANDPTSVLLTKSSSGFAVTGISVSAAVLAKASQSTGTIISTSTSPSYFTNSEPVSYTLPNMERCMYKCRLECETGNEVPSVNGLPALPLERPRVCKKQCLSHCGFGRPFIPSAV
mmetsp:Transcript_66378/g.163543  ORF Transcript_66378/g.163543 Transcript_66378/m.163543 type:complete len:3114 (+) Transcript_66378:219-9560(+)